MGVGFLLLDYDDPDSADKVINTDHFIFGRKLYIQRREYREPSKYVLSMVLNRDIQFYFNKY